ncbi:conserved Plasmodium protein, unknown function [Plasmodium berghei]|uniref:Uncharacterized protein n=2 Tax=Plasmodium berghei TaxID=5821 RepID=A0A509ANY9_PLABA|nr:conserved Plasmodium protein, unknown function [Plasmodium berghei ANKA]CXI99183.1 conserved Plasmodium protein, unknown function [Plasmodium berghei]SCL97832.1 conserved Plasmodium protein, unknown function [Plasmodium berghei]SCM18488.1 conserved Plasmodium protein, unknown function [Plasmodium berghei]SCN27921.1 conserved Plasmodium protein, unknown function [Plasmodium berghei]VUC57803.1 conserved Plasmodium protein, unknown function [Plasmodium berghei ANKA]|eukprot:XP_034423573.1 conserved Plasmodium protein, unknown function [Plasmodium berghei ANKA]
MNYRNDSNGVLNNNENSKKSNNFLNNYENISASKNSSAEEIAEKYLRSKLSLDFKSINKVDYNLNSKNEYYDNNKNIDNTLDYTGINNGNSYISHNDKLNYFKNTSNNYSGYEEKGRSYYDTINKTSLYSDIVNNTINVNYSNCKNDENKLIYTNLKPKTNNIINIIGRSNSRNLTEFSHLNSLKDDQPNNYYAKNDSIKYEKDRLKNLQMKNQDTSNNANLLISRYNSVNSVINDNNVGNDNLGKYKYGIIKPCTEIEMEKNNVVNNIKIGDSLLNKRDNTYNNNNKLFQDNKYYYKNGENKYYMENYHSKNNNNGNNNNNSNKRNLMQRNKDYVHYLSKRNSILKNDLSIKKDLKKKPSVSINLKQSHIKNKVNIDRYKHNTFFNSFYKSAKNKYNEIELMNSVNIFNTGNGININNNNNNDSLKNVSIKNDNSYLGTFEKDMYKINNSNDSNFNFLKEKLGYTENISSVDYMNNSEIDISFLKSTYSDSSKIIDSPLNYENETFSTVKKHDINDELLIKNVNNSIRYTHRGNTGTYSSSQINNHQKLDNIIYNENVNNDKSILPCGAQNVINVPNNEKFDNNNLKMYSIGNTFKPKNTDNVIIYNDTSSKKEIQFAYDQEINYFTQNSIHNKNNVYGEKDKLKNMNDLYKKGMPNELGINLPPNRSENKQNNILSFDPNKLNIINKKYGDNLILSENIKRDINSNYIDPTIKYTNNNLNSDYNMSKLNDNSDKFNFNSAKIYINKENNNCELYDKNTQNHHIGKYEYNNNNNNMGIVLKGVNFESDDKKKIENFNFIDRTNLSNNNGKNISPLYFSENKLSNIFNNKIEKNKLLNVNNNQIGIDNKLKNKKYIMPPNENINITNTKKTRDDKNFVNELSNINNYEDYYKYISDSINNIPITIKNMNILLALALYFLNFNINNNSTKNELSDDVLIKLLNKFLYCLNLKTCLLKEKKLNNNENKYYFIQIKKNESLVNNAFTDNNKEEPIIDEKKKNELNKNKEMSNNKDDTTTPFFTFYNKRVIRNKNDQKENNQIEIINNRNCEIDTDKKNKNIEKTNCFYLDENMKIITLGDIYKIAWCLCVLKKNFMYIDLLRILYKESESMIVEKELIFCVTYIFKYCRIIEIEDCKNYLNNNTVIHLDNNSNENLCMYLHLLHICSIHDETFINVNHKKNVDKIISYFYDKIEKLNIYMCTNILCALANLNIKNDEYPIFFNKMLNYFRNNIKKMNKSILLVNIAWSLCIIEVPCSEFLKDLSEYVINILHFIPLSEFITISCCFSCQKIIVIKNYFQNLKRNKEINQEKAITTNLSNNTINEYKQYEFIIYEYYEKKKVFPYYFYKKPTCNSIIFKILAYSFLHYDQRIIDETSCNVGDNINVSTNSYHPFSDVNNDNRKTVRSLSVENKSQNPNNIRNFSVHSSRFNSSNISTNVKNTYFIHDENQTNYGSKFIHSNNYVRSEYSADCDRNNRINTSNHGGNKWNNFLKINIHNNANNNSKGGFENNKNLFGMNKSIINKPNDYKSGIENNNNTYKGKYTKKINEKKKKLKEYYNLYDRNNNYEFTLNSFERILFTNLIEDCCNNFEKINTIHLIELLYTLCILNLDKKKIVKLVENKIDKTMFNETYEKLILKRKKKYIDTYKNYTSEEIDNEKHDLIILHYIYNKFVQENIIQKDLIDYNFSIVVDNIYFNKYVNDDIFFNIIKGSENIGENTFKKLKSILNSASYWEKEIKENDKNVRNHNEKVTHEFNQNHTFCNSKNRDFINEIDEKDREKTINHQNLFDNSKGHQLIENRGNDKNIYNNDILNNETQLVNEKIKEKCEKQLHQLNLFDDVYLKDNMENEFINREYNKTPKELTEFKNDLKNAYDIAINYYNKKTNYIEGNNINNIVYPYNNKNNRKINECVETKNILSNTKDDEIMSQEMYNNIITKRNIKNILDSHNQKHGFERKNIKFENNNNHNVNYKKENIDTFNFYKLFILLLKVSTLSMVSFVFVFVYMSLK